MDYNKLPAYREGARMIKTAKIVKILCIVWILLGSLSTIVSISKLCQENWRLRELKPWGILACLLIAAVRMILISYVFSLIRKEGKLVQDFSVLKYEHEKLLSKVGGLESVEQKEPDSDVPGTWRCVCGRRNQNYVSTCSCGVNKRDIKG